ncbi:sarcosine oxidase subunit gamma [Nitratireductor indicus]|uniref:sarcosine oxidase subunit gamma n=1 Tax=Nitratireductor indicus TaxID=721133 RepID=UPI00287713C0|nr:sarcosine oxidase subunit gamma [Nitratireductor indicus]MDS1137929.1 sarcosine oxidase subunit gamma [Nitratireductor indicus]
MADMLPRDEILEGRMVESEGVTVMPAAPASRLSLRAPEKSLASLSKALGLELPTNPKSSATVGSRAALWLGPDEWLVIEGSGAALAAACARVKAFHAAVDISHRNTGLIVSGPRCADVLNAGCPQDLSLAAFPVGAASRTVLGKAEVVLWRTARDAFRVECWRSFADYVFMLLEAAARDV